MTVREYLTKSLRVLKLTDDDIDIIIAKGGLLENDQADFKVCDRVIYKERGTIKKRLAFNITEGGYSSTLNKDLVDDFFKDLGVQCGLRKRVSTATFL